MDRRLLVVAAVVATVALSGCAWVQQPDVTTTPQSTNDTDILVPSFRLEEHATALENRSFALEIQVDVTTGQTERNETIRVRSNPSTERFLRVNETATRTLSLFLANETLFSRIDANETRYRRQNLSALNQSFAPIHRNRIERRWLTEIYSAANFEPVGNTTVDGRQVTEFRLSNTSLDDSASVQMTRTTGVIYIDRANVIRRATIDLRGNRGNERVTFSVDYEIQQVGNVSVADPAWLEEARTSAETDGNTAGGSNETTASG